MLTQQTHEMKNLILFNKKSADSTDKTNSAHSEASNKVENLTNESDSNEIQVTVDVLIDLSCYKISKL